MRRTPLFVGLLASLLLGAAAGAYPPAPAGSVAARTARALAPHTALDVLDHLLLSDRLHHVAIPATGLAALAAREAALPGPLGAVARSLTQLDDRLAPSPRAAGSSGQSSTYCGPATIQHALHGGSVGVTEACQTIGQGNPVDAGGFTINDFSTTTTYSMHRWSNGSTLWHRSMGTHELEALTVLGSVSHPVLVEIMFDGIVAEGSGGVAHTEIYRGVDPATGKVLWERDYKPQVSSTPVTRSTVGAGTLQGIVADAHGELSLVAGIRTRTQILVSAAVGNVSAGDQLDDRTVRFVTIDSHSGILRSAYPTIDSGPEYVDAFPMTSLDSGRGDDLVLTVPTPLTADPTRTEDHGNLVGVDLSSAKKLWTSMQLPMGRDVLGLAVPGGSTPRSSVIYMLMRFEGTLPSASPVNANVFEDDSVSSIVATTGHRRWMLPGLFAWDVAKGLSGIYHHASQYLDPSSQGSPLDTAKPDPTEYVAVVRDDASQVWKHVVTTQGETGSSFTLTGPVGDVQPDGAQECIVSVIRNVGVSTTFDTSVLDGRTGRELHGGHFQMPLGFSYDGHGDDLVDLASTPPSTTTFGIVDGLTGRLYRSWALGAKTYVGDVEPGRDQMSSGPYIVIGTTTSRGHEKLMLEDLHTGRVLHRVAI